ncbi:MAG: hypothetical protein DRJ35_05665 [Thermoprotei archaeon]|nr:MAG: hypothetical protein DRJ35_05665 [Thermoprotei archaeon]
MRVEEAAETITKKLEEKGYKTKQLKDAEGYKIEVDIRGRKAEIRLIEEEQQLKELHLRYENVPGVTILKCERYDTILKCIEELVNTLKA